MQKLSGQGSFPGYPVFGISTFVISPGNLMTESEQEGVCGYLVVCRSLGIDQKVSI